MCFDVVQPSLVLAHDDTQSWTTLKATDGEPVEAAPAKSKRAERHGTSVRGLPPITDSG